MGVRGGSNNNSSENHGERGRGHLSLGTIILTEQGRGGEGSFVSRNNDSNHRTREKGSFVSWRGGEGSFVSWNNDSNCRTRERWRRVICLETMILTVEPGRGGHLFLGTIILTENKEEVGRGHLSLGTMILTVEPDL